MRQIKLTISELAVVTGIHRQTVSKRLKETEPLSGSSCKKKIYDLKTALVAIYSSEGKHNAKQCSNDNY